MTAKLTGKNKTSYLNQFGGIAIVEEEAEVGGGIIDLLAVDVWQRRWCDKGEDPIGCKC